MYAKKCVCLVTPKAVCYTLLAKLKCRGGREKERGRERERERERENGKEREREKWDRKDIPKNSSTCRELGFHGC